MARNEEKQLARLNRLYLQQQKEEELKKRPPRPKLATLNTVEDIKKWLPTVVRDIDFYVKQMEVTCYPQRQIEEFEHRVDHLRGEYKAFIHKLHQLEPDLKTSPWCDRPYAGKRRKTDADVCSESKNDTVGKDSENREDTQQKDNSNLRTFVPLCTPVLKNSSLCRNWYGFEKPKVPDTHESEIQMHDEPLQFEFQQKLPKCKKLEISFDAVKWPDNHSRISLHECNTQGIGSIESCESSAHSHRSSNQGADVSGDLTEVSSASALLHCSTSQTKHLEKYSLNATQLHTISESDRTSVECACDHSVLIEKIKVKDNCASSLNDNLGVSGLGSLNLPYTDSSSSDAET
ncbi:hypothetical protein BsWGS_02840 [Bradybaena similaris]